MTDKKVEPIFIVKNNLPEGADLIGKVEASEAIIDVSGETINLLHSRVRSEVIKKVHEGYETQDQLYLVPTSYDIRNEVAGKTGYATCDVYII
ncbi:MAG: hypothetical protein Q7S55_04985 [Nanoarchaeota archaeon]|nr:hypothetical protein [Nanoarchaeota archaeon]